MLCQQCHPCWQLPGLPRISVCHDSQNRFKWHYRTTDTSDNLNSRGRSSYLALNRHMLAFLRSVGSQFGLLGVTWVTCSCLGLAAESAVKPPTVHYNHDTFYIPFTAGTSISPELTAREVLLFVSGDRGASWQLYQRQAPSAARFAFRAAVDGEYWFAVRTLFGDQGTPSTDDMQAELKVVLDTLRPKLEMSAALMSPQEAGVVWGISDDNLDPNTFKMEYRTSSVGIWQPILPSSIEPIDGGYSGEISWQLARPARSIEIRAAVRDAAGNETQVQDTIRVTESSPPPSLAAQPNRPIAGHVQVEGPSSQGDLLIQTQRAQNPAIAHHNDDGAWRTAAPVKQLSPIRIDEVPTARMIVNPTLQQPTTLQQPNRVLDSAVASELLTSVDKAAPQAPLATPSPNPPHTAKASTLRNASPPPTQAHMSPSKLFQLDYDVETTIEDDVARVSLWVTMDNGRTWSLYGEDPDRVSPFLVNVESDGVYGFRMLIENRNGIAPRPPQSGETADVWIHVDSTKPTARIVSARFGRNAHLGQLQIFWDAADENLTENPVTLLYSDQPNGPWRVIAEQLANTSRYDWTVKETVPADFYLQLEVRDKAGNLSRDTLRDPISRDGFAPRGVIRDVRPADQTVAPATPSAAGVNGSTPLPSQLQAPIAPPTGRPAGVPRVPAQLDYPQSETETPVKADVIQASLPSGSNR